MDKRHFHRLLTRYRSGECTDREAKVVDQWFALIDSDRAKLTTEEAPAMETKLWQAIQENTMAAPDSSSEQAPVVHPASKPLHFFAQWRWIAAALFLLVGLGGYEWIRRNASDQQGQLAQANLLTKTNNSGSPEWVLLSDGSRVSLQPKSRLRYPANFQTGRREIYLEGRAFFEVSRDEKNPFLVYTGAIATKVLGTSFWVSANKNYANVEVSVATGKVAVFQKNKQTDDNSNDLKSGVILTRNQSVKYAADTRLFTTMLAKQPIVDEKFRGDLVFDDADLGEVIQKMESAYGIDIVLTNERLKKCLFTADITKQPMFTQLDMIAAAVNAQYSVKDTKIYLSGAGCQ